MKTIRRLFQIHRKLSLTLVFVIGFFLVFNTPSLAQVADQAERREVATEQEAQVKLDWLETTILDFISGITFAVGGMVAGIGGVMLDLTVDKTIIQMGSTLGSGTDVGKGIIGVWKVLRDIINIFFIFGLIFIGIKTILNSQSSETRHTLSMLIVAALIINFSLYITEVVIDFSNIAAIQVYNQIADTNLLSNLASKTLNLPDNSIAGGFLNVASVGSLFNGGAAKTNLDFFPSIFYSLLMMVFLVIAGAVFFMGALLLIKRFIALILYMIFSPIMFIGWILPAFASRQEQWRTGFIQQAFLAPVFLFMLYLSLVVLNGLHSSIVKTGAGFGGITNGAEVEMGTFSVILFFFLAIGFLYASIKTADEMSKKGASSSLKLFDGARAKIMGMAQNTVGGMTAGMAARAGRATIGRAANAAAESNSLRDNASLKGVRGWAARQTLKGTRVVADSNMDVRSLGVAGGALGKGRKGGYKTATADIKKSEEEFAKSLGEIDDDDKVVEELIKNEHDLVHELEPLEEAKKESLKKYQAAKQRGDVVEIKNAKDELEHSQHEIEVHKKLIKTAKEQIATEKNRRVVGSAVANAKYKETTDELKKLEDEKAALGKAFTESSDVWNDDMKKASLQKISEANKQIVELQKLGKIQAEALGYAATLETAKPYQSWIIGRNNVQDKAAGKALRKTYTKKSLKSEAKDHAKHDDHGGGHKDDHAAHDDHGGDHGAAHDDHGGGGGHH